MKTEDPLSYAMDDRAGRAVQFWNEYKQVAGAGFGGLLLIWYDMIWYDMIWYDMIWMNEWIYEWIYFSHYHYYMVSDAHTQ